MINHLNETNIKHKLKWILNAGKIYLKSFKNFIYYTKFSHSFFFKYFVCSQYTNIRENYSKCIYLYSDSIYMFCLVKRISTAIVTIYLHAFIWICVYLYNICNIYEKSKEVYLLSIRNYCSKFVYFFVYIYIITMHTYKQQPAIFNHIVIFIIQILHSFLTKKKKKVSGFNKITFNIPKNMGIG